MEFTLAIEHIADTQELIKTSKRINALYKASGYIPAIGDTLKSDDKLNPPSPGEFIVVVDRFLVGNEKRGHTLILYITDQQGVSVPLIQKHRGRTEIELPAYLYSGD